MYGGPTCTPKKTLCNQLNLLGFVVLLKKQKVPHKNVMALKSFQANFKMAAVAVRAKQKNEITSPKFGLEAEMRGFIYCSCNHWQRCHAGYVSTPVLKFVANRLFS